MGADLEAVIEGVRAILQRKYEAREHAYKASRDAIRFSANSIRAEHRGEIDKAAELRDQARQILDQAVVGVQGHADIYHAGFLTDAQKEYAEATLMAAMVEGKPIPSPQQLSVEPAAYLNGLGEAVGELRRVVLDRLRRDEVEECEEILETMDEIYSMLVTIDYPDGMTGGLRRTTDMVRGVLEKTRGDLTVALRERRLTERLDQLSL